MRPATRRPARQRVMEGATALPVLTVARMALPLSAMGAQPTAIPALVMQAAIMAASRKAALAGMTLSTEMPTRVIRTLAERRTMVELRIVASVTWMEEQTGGGGRGIQRERDHHGPGANSA